MHPASFMMTLLSSSSCFLILLLACSFTATPCLGFTSNPPLGNSIALSASTSEGKITYSCHHGKWLPVSIAASLVESGNEHKPVGSYLRTFSNISQSGLQPYDNDHDNAGTWSLINTDGDEAESGHSSSLVAGTIISSRRSSNNSATYMQDFLSQASRHQFDGEASRVSYIMQQNAVIDKLPPEHCIQEKCTLNLTYKAEYVFWKQDMVPPALIPSRIAVDPNHEQFVEALFATGIAEYAAVRGRKWALKGAAGRLYDVPGGEELGSFQMNGSLLCLRSEEGATSKYAYTCAKPLPNVGPIVVNSLSLPWFLMSITNSTGNLITFGSLSSIQIVSTFGGGAPSIPPNTLDGANQSSFTAIFWIYTHQH